MSAFLCVGKHLRKSYFIPGSLHTWKNRGWIVKNNHLPPSQVSCDTIYYSVMDVASLCSLALWIHVNFQRLWHPLEGSFTEYLLVKSTRAHHTCIFMLWHSDALCFVLCCFLPVLSLSSVKNKVSQQKWKCNESYL